MDVRRVASLVVFGFVATLAARARQQCSMAKPGWDNSQKNVSIHVLNILRPPFLNQLTTVCNTPQIYLLDVMEQATDQDKNFRFSATFFNKELGWFVDAYNFVYANYTLDFSYWQILDGEMKPLPVGISNYIPANGETVTFNLTVTSGK